MLMKTKLAEEVTCAAKVTTEQLLFWIIIIIINTQPKKERNKPSYEISKRF